MKAHLFIFLILFSVAGSAHSSTGKSQFVNFFLEGEHIMSLEKGVYSRMEFDDRNENVVHAFFFPGEKENHKLLSFKIFHKRRWQRSGIDLDYTEALKNDLINLSGVKKNKAELIGLESNVYYRKHVRKKDFCSEHLAKLVADYAIFISFSDNCQGYYSLQTINEVKEKGQNIFMKVQDYKLKTLENDLKKLMANN